MRLLLGSPGSGKSTLILNEVRSRLASPRPGFLLLTPTATMAEHLRNILAREGLLVRPGAITTLAQFLSGQVSGMTAATPADLELLVAAELEESKPGILAALSGSAGLAGSLAGALDELANSGCTALQWEALRAMGVCTGPLAVDLGRIYDGVERRLNEHGLYPRSRRLAAATSALRRSWPREVNAVFLDGFFTFSSGELELIRVMASKTDLTVALPEWKGVSPTRAALIAMGLSETRLTPKRSSGQTLMRPAPTRNREVEQIAARILELRGQGASWRDCLVILRGNEPYLPMVRSTFERFGIPCRAYFAEALAAHPAARAFMAAIAAVLSGLEHGNVLNALRPPVTIAGTSRAFAVFESRVLEGLPAVGSEPLKTIAGSIPGGGDAILRCLGVLESIVAASSEARPANEWAKSLRALAGLLAAPPANAAYDAAARSIWRARSAAINGLFSCLDQAVLFCGKAPVSLEIYWRNVAPILEGASLRIADHRRETVAVVDAHEARQWEAPYVFACGLLEGEFPRRAQPDPILGDDLRLKLNKQGFALRLRKEREDEEELLLGIALSRATRETRLSYPEFNEKGEPTLPSFRLQNLAPARAPETPIRIRPSRDTGPSPAVAIDSVDLHASLASAHALFRATALESFVQCPFQFHAAHTLRLASPPPLPSGRLNALFLGSVLHTVLQEWHQKRSGLDQIFDSVWAGSLRRERIPPSHQVEFERIVMLRSLREFEDKARIEDGWRVFAETPFEIPLDGCTVKGKIDRHDVNIRNEARIFDFKYTGGAGLKHRKDKLEQGLLLQGGLYALALRTRGLKPVSFEYCAVKKEPVWAGFETPEEVAAEMSRARATAEESAFRILQGVITVDPRDRDSCAYCAYLDICRVPAETAVEEIAAA